jgi:hypothetical protein
MTVYCIWQVPKATVATNVDANDLLQVVPPCIPLIAGVFLEAMAGLRYATWALQLVQLLLLLTALLLQERAWSAILYVITLPAALPLAQG